MDYLFMAVQKETTRSGEFGNRKEALEYFEKRFGSDVAEEKGPAGHFEQRYDFRCQPVFGGTFLILRLAGICQIGSGYQVVEERYSCSGWKGSGEDGILEVRKRIPKAVTANSISLEGYQESSEAASQFQKTVKKITAEARRNFRKAACG